MSIENHALAKKTQGALVCMKVDGRCYVFTIVSEYLESRDSNETGASRVDAFTLVVQSCIYPEYRVLPGHQGSSRSPKARQTEQYITSPFLKERTVNACVQYKLLYTFK